MFATVNIVDSQHAKTLTETAARDSNAMKQVSNEDLLICTVNNDQILQIS